MPFPTLALAKRPCQLNPQDLADLLLASFGIGRRKIHLINHGNNFQAGVARQIRVRQRLSLDALRGIDQQASAPSQAAKARETS